MLYAETHFPNSYVEVLTPNVTVLRDTDFRGKITRAGPNPIELMLLLNEEENPDPISAEGKALEEANKRGIFKPQTLEISSV